MADYTDITAGTGQRFATPEFTIGGELRKVQYVTPFMQRTRVAVTPVISTSAYTSGDCLGPITTVAGMARVSGYGGVIKGIQIVDKTQAQRSAMTILLFNQTVTTAADNAAFTCSDADMLNCVAQIEVLSTHYNTAWPGTPANSLATLPHNDAASTPIAMEVPYTCAATSLFMQLVVRGTPTYTTTSDIVVSFIVIPD